MNMGLSDKITVVGYDMGEQTATQLLDENSPLYCTLEQDMYTMGYKAVEQLVKTCGAKRPSAPGATPSIWKASSTARKISLRLRPGWTATTSWPTADFPRFT